MKTDFHVPSLVQLAKILQNDALRDLSLRKKIQNQSSKFYTLDFLERVNCARFEPRIAESIVERL